MERGSIRAVWTREAGNERREIVAVYKHGWAWKMRYVENLAKRSSNEWGASAAK
jgi:hypothetical protein